MRRQGMCRHNASSGGPGTSPMCRHNASSASARNVLPKLRVPCIYIYIHIHVYYMHVCMYIYIHMHITYLLCMYIHVHIVIIRYVRSKGSGLALVLHEQISLRVFHLIAM